MGDLNFDFNGDSLAPEQEHLFDDLLDDLAFESEIGTYGNNFLDFDFGAGVLDLPSTGAEEDPFGDSNFSFGGPVPTPPSSSSLTSSNSNGNNGNGSRPGAMSNSAGQRVVGYTGHTAAGEEDQFNANSSNSSASHKRKKSNMDPSQPFKKPETDIKATYPQKLSPPAVVSASQLGATRIAALTALPVSLLKAFNGGDIQKVREIVRDNTLKNCALRTPSLDTELFGQNYISAFFESVYDSHPDAVWVAKKSKFVSDRNEVTARIYFAGTRIATATKGADLSGAYSDHLFKKKGSSLLDEMDVSALTEAETHAMKELENLGCNLSVFGKGTLTLLVDEESGKISKFSCMWLITSFRQATV